MNQILYITTSFDQPELIEDIIERLADCRYDTGYDDAKLPGFLHAIDSSSVETYVSGTVELSFDDEEDIMIPFTTCFLFTFTKEKNDFFKLDCCLSLS